MKIVDREYFLALPTGTIYSKFKPDIFDSIEIKGESWLPSIPEDAGDFFSQQIADAIKAHSSDELFDSLYRAVHEGANLEIDLYSEYRDGLYDKDQLFAVWDHDDVSKLIERLNRALVDSALKFQKVKS